MSTAMKDFPLRTSGKLQQSTHRWRSLLGSHRLLLKNGGVHALSKNLIERAHWRGIRPRSRHAASVRLKKHLPSVRGRGGLGSRGKRLGRRGSCFPAVVTLVTCSTFLRM